MLWRVVYCSLVDGCYCYGELVASICRVKVAKLGKRSYSRDRRRGKWVANTGANHSQVFGGGSVGGKACRQLKLQTVWTA
jgi:hypothetical protein